MTTGIYYFTGTGNCLVVARRVAVQMGCEPIPIVRALGESSIRTDADTVGVVFPCYLAALHGVPLAVERFVSRLEDLRSKHFFAICTCGGYEIVNAFLSIRSLRTYVRSQGGRLAAAYTVRLPMNNLDYEHIPVPIETDSASIIEKAEAQVDDVCKRIAWRRNGKHNLSRELLALAMTPMYSMMAKSCMKSLRELAKEPTDSQMGFRELMPLTDRSIRLEEGCTGCGTCARVCPVGNIELVDGGPVWRHRCEMCFACDEWCPSGAIHHWGRPDGAKYHHPEVRAKDLFSTASPGGAAQHAHQADNTPRQS